MFLTISILYGLYDRTGDGHPMCGSVLYTLGKEIIGPINQDAKEQIPQLFKQVIEYAIDAGLVEARAQIQDQYSPRSSSDYVDIFPISHSVSIIPNI